MAKTPRRAFSALEMLVTIGCLSVLAMLLLPALQAAQEHSLEMQCQEHLRKIGQGALAHLEAQGHYPTNGWGSRWVGDPDRGFGAEQPGGWIYNILPYIGEEKLHDLGKGEGRFKKQAANRARLTTPLATFNCPVRRKSELYPHLATALFANADLPEKSAKSDYAVNGGDVPINSGVGPASDEAEAMKAYVWPDLSFHTGISLVRSRVTAADVTDGKSMTYLAGEKYVPTHWYGPNPLDATKPKVRGDDGSMYAGCDADVRRWTNVPPLRDAEMEDKASFGSAHAEGIMMVFCDGSARSLNFDIDPALHKSLGNRKDGSPKE